MDEERGAAAPLVPPDKEQAADSPWLDSLYEADPAYRAFVDDHIIR
jgi:hypothetical protein